MREQSNDEIVFFIDKAQFNTSQQELTAGAILLKFAEEDPAETTLVLSHGNDLTRYENDSQLIKLINGMHFVVFYDGPTQVSAFGPNRLQSDLKELGYDVELTQDKNNQFYAVIRDYVVPLGKYAGRKIQLAIPAMPNFPQAVGTSIHIYAEPQLLEKTDSVPNVRNIIDSALGDKWRYWSRNLNWDKQKKTTRRLMAIIAGVFKNV